MQLWSAWVSWWPIFMLLLFACLVTSTLMTLIFLVKRRSAEDKKQARLPRLYLLLTVIHCVFAVFCIGRNFPSA